jgi:hypothetical protein
LAEADAAKQRGNNPALPERRSSFSLSSFFRTARAALHSPAFALCAYTGFFADASR